MGLIRYPSVGVAAVWLTARYVEAGQSFDQTPTGGSFSAKVAITAPKGLAVDQATGSVYVSNESGVSKFDQNLTPILAPAWINPGVSGPLAVDPTTGDLLIGDQGANQVKRFASNGTPGAIFASDPWTSRPTPPARSS